jgi:trimethylamine corrinoid protein
MNSVSYKIFDKAKHAVIDLDEQAVGRIARKALKVGVNPFDLVEQGFIEGMKELGDSFEAGKAELSQIFKAYQVVELGINVLRPTIKSSQKDVIWLGNLIVVSDAISAYPLVSYVIDALPSSYCC